MIADNCINVVTERDFLRKPEIRGNVTQCSGKATVLQDTTPDVRMFYVLKESDTLEELIPISLARRPLTIQSGRIPSISIVKVVTEAKYRLLSLREDWDGEGSPGFQAKTLEAVAFFLYKLSFESSLAEQFATEAKILPSCEGSIDLYWQNEQFGLVIVFRQDGTFSFYGADNRRGNIIRGEEQPSTTKIATWLKERQV
ncbi:MAG: hypothetical protein OXR72_05015 [Gemmatimonadota bacterium]|nr:hypothetical protein [Gemmatimonadota bacterium]